MTSQFKIEELDALSSNEDTQLASPLSSVPAFVCNACGGQRCALLGTRKDGLAVFRCEGCGLGVTAVIPDDPRACYGLQKLDGSVGYSDLSWAAELVCRLKSAGKILDIRCADGSLLKELPGTFDLYGIEGNEGMTARATEAAIKIVGRDLFDPRILEEYAHQFDCVTAIAVFEYLGDFRRGIQTALNLLKPNGFLLFEVPYISDTHESKVWFEGSLGRVFYPSKGSLRLLMKDLGFHLVGREIHIRGFGSNFIGIAFREQSLVEHVEELFKTVTGIEGRISDRDLRLARQKLMLIHAAHSAPDLLIGLSDLSHSSLDVPLLDLVEKLWASDLDELAATRSELERLRARVALLDLNYADLGRAARAETELKEQEIAKLRESGSVQALRRGIGKSISLLRRAARRALKFLRWCANFDLRLKTSEIVANQRGNRAEQTSGRPPADPLINFRGRLPRDKGSPALLLVLPATVIGGAERLLSAVVAHLAKEGWRVTVLTTNDPGHGNGDTTSWFERGTTEIFHLPRFLARKHWPDFVSYLIASRSIEVVWIAGSTFLYNLLPVIRTSFPDVRVADILFNTVGHTQNNRKFAELIDVNFVENSEVLQFLLKAGESRDRILQVSSGIDLQEYHPGPREASVTNLLNATHDELIVGFSGRWSDEKDPLIFVEIARRLSHLPIHFVMTGAGPLRLRIEEAIASGKLGNRFHLVGEVEDVRPWIRSYDALVLPSRLDGRPVVVLEALALGVPVIASAVGGLPELVDDGVNGSLCVPGIAAHFAGKIARLALDRELLIRMKKAARLSAEQNLDSRKMLASYEQALRDLTRSEK